MAILDKILGTFLGNKSEKDIKKLLPAVEKINEEYAKFADISNDQLREKTQNLKKEINDFFKTEKDEIDSLKADIEADKFDMLEREDVYKRIDKLEETIDKKIEDKLNELIPQAFAIIKDTARRFFENETLEVTANDFDQELAPHREDITIKGKKAIYSNKWLAGGTQITWDMIHYDVQLIGGIILHQGQIAEMATGEGKTLVATLPVFLNALTGRGVHMVTVNDYLAKRDAEWMGTLYQFHGLSVDCIDKHQPNSEARRSAYKADITFGTNNEFGFDYLRDNMALSPNDLVQRRHNYVIVDEVDSVLVDDARTPLIISGAVSRGGQSKDEELFKELKTKVVQLHKVQRQLVTKLLTDAKRLLKSEDKKEREQGAIYLLRAHKGLPKNTAIIKFLSEEGMKTLVYKTENIYLAENAKRMPEITEELYFVIEEKNNSIELTDKGIDLISAEVDEKDFFVLPDIGSIIADLENSGKSEKEILLEKDKLLTDYSVKTVRVHAINQLLKAYAMFEKDVEYVLIDNQVKIVDEQTGRIMEGRRYSDGLHQAIEAKENVKVEASTQTYATITLQNYFRMYHKLAGMTGTAETEAKEFWDIYELDVTVIPTNVPIVRDDRQDFVYKTKREKYNAVIFEVNDLVKAGRPVLVGTTSVEISELLSRMLKIRKIEHNVLNAKLHQREADIVAKAGQAGIVTIATNMAGRGTDIKLTKEVKEAGGLAIVATERHDSRRVDRQLRGRSGRQGDPGSSQFFVSLEDDLMRMFGSDKISGLMDRMGLKDGEVIQHSMISKSIERAQKKVEENNFGIRKRLLEYDDVMNAQREVIYKLRKHALYGDRLSVDLANMLYDTCTSVVHDNYGFDYEDFKLELLRNLVVESPVSEEEFKELKPQKITDLVFDIVVEDFKRRKQSIVDQAYPVIKNVYETMSGQYKNIDVPITDGINIYHIIVNLEKAYETKGKQVAIEFEKQIVLSTIDASWKENLREMDDLKQSVQNASYEQKDPLLIYKFESYELFKSMLDINNKTVVNALLKAKLHSQNAGEIQQGRVQKLDVSKYDTEKEEYSREASGQGQGQGKQKTEPIRVGKKIGRNDIVKVKYKTGKVVETKYKKVIIDIESGDAVLIE
ncbi:MAG: preprotein translocase subunit SecA [Bacteroidales bacterium]|nr:preprotein translocase subunit SecA [Bacteroidales bacterium]